MKDIAVYERAGDLSEFLGKDANDKKLVMDVRLKKEYRQGFMANIEGGYGTDSRYIGRMFAMRYTTLSQIGIYANVNNLNDAQQPDKTKVFDPAKMLQGLRREQKAGLTFNTKTADNSYSINGNFDWTRSTVHDDATATRINFLPGGNTYGYSFRNSKNVTNSLFGYTRMTSRRKSDWTTASLRATYRNNESASSSTEAAFSTERADVTRQLIEGIYGAGGDLTDIINRAISLNRRKGHQFNGSVFLSEQIKVPYTTDALTISFDGRYGEQRDRGFNSYLINTGVSAVPTTCLCAG